MSNDRSKKFSQLYCRPEHLLQDSKFFRKRIVKFYQAYIHDKTKFCETLISETGVDIQTPPYGGLDLFKILDENICPINKFLDIITIGYQLLHDSGYITKDYVSEIGRIFSEEHMDYCINDTGEVRFFVDEEFQNSRALTIKRDCKKAASMSMFSLIIATNLLYYVKDGN